MGQAGAHGGGRRPGITLSWDKGPPRARPLTDHSLQSLRPWVPLPILLPLGGVQDSHRPVLTLPCMGPLRSHRGQWEEEVAAFFPPGQPETQKPSLCLGAPTRVPRVRLGLSGHCVCVVCGEGLCVSAHLCSAVSVLIFLLVCSWERAGACTTLADFVSPLCDCECVCDRVR